MVNAQRLKPYYDPKDRPTNIPDAFQGNEDELDPEELHDKNVIEEHPPIQNNRQQPVVPRTNNNDNNGQQLPIPININNRPNHYQQQSDILRTNNRQLQNQQTGETNRINPAASRNSTVDAPIKDNTPSCQDCNNNKCIAFKEEDIQQVQSSARGFSRTQGTLQTKLLDQDIEIAKEKRLKQNKCEHFFGITTDGKIHEVRYNADGTTDYLSGFKNPNIAPEWSKIISNGAMNNFIHLLESQYNKEIDVPW
ncbi:unnamed protein product [Mytilus coruscus]|uniref:Uncharacterized protein n=1 Tax=Mytilus coruscus TaxID=42192 RepID=A0A6J8C1P1_MYTCO|nr:unnamed protein product [Mytilus coruscus]